ncbi:hypothetical protein B0H11DRAFT_2018774 [Mycena galericulata]|nr:hypothetical protein B0H11DRAFT_2018774 [Mycena galericulata]
MRFISQFFGVVGTLAALAPVFLLSLPPVSALALVAPRNINASLVPAACTSACQPALSAQSTCSTNLTCLCTNTNGNSFAQCIDCVVGTDPDSLAQSAGEGVLSDYTGKCAQDNIPISSLTLSFSPTGSPAASPSQAVDKSNGAIMRVPRVYSFVPAFAAVQFVVLLVGMLSAVV